jgi:hypothetical protein
MQAETRTFTGLFQLAVRYVIPLYQRPYVRTRERQWEPLWQDIETVANHLVEIAGYSDPGCAVATRESIRGDGPALARGRRGGVSGQGTCRSRVVTANAEPRAIGTYV